MLDVCYIPETEPAPFFFRCEVTPFNREDVTGVLNQHFAAELAWDRDHAQAISFTLPNGYRGKISAGDYVALGTYRGRHMRFMILTGLTPRLELMRWEE